MALRQLLQIAFNDDVLGLNYQKYPVDFYPGREHQSDWFLELNPLGQLPVLVDDGLVLRDAQAILVYLSSRYDKSKCWYPTEDPARLGEVSQWLAFSDSITATASAARLHDSLLFELDVEACRADAIDCSESWNNICGTPNGKTVDGYAGDHPTIADIACFPYVMLSEEGGISRWDYPAIRRWTDRVKRIPGFIVMSGIFRHPRLRLELRDLVARTHIYGRVTIDITTQPQANRQER